MALYFLLMSKRASQWEAMIRFRLSKQSGRDEMRPKNVQRKCLSPPPELWAIRTLATALFAGSALAPVPLSAASLYRCMDQTGQWVFTDRTVQMSQCILLSRESLSISPLPVPSAITPDVEVIETSIDNHVPPLSDPPLSSNRGISIPVRRIGQLYVVSVELNGSRTAQLILDTGASHTILSQELVRELALMPSDYRPGLVQLKTASGSVDAQVVRIDSMKIASAEVRNSAAAVHTVPDFPAGVDGLLGLNFLHQFEITLDSSKGELHLKQVSP